MVDPTRATQERINPLFGELTRLDVGISGFKRKAGEPPVDYRSRVQSFGQLYSRYGLQLISSPQYQGASDDDRREAIKLLNSRSKDLVD
jgi:hypothetical protein